MFLDGFIDEFRNWTVEFGGEEKHSNPIGNYIFRNFTKEQGEFPAKGAYFGCISPDEDFSGQYSDLCCVVFPDKEDGPWVIALGVGSSGFKNDYELADIPGVRRRFLKHIDNNGFVKSSFLDIDSSLARSFIEKVPNLKETLSRYAKVLLACEIIEQPWSEEGKNRIKAFLAEYAQMRNWRSNKEYRQAISHAISRISSTCYNIDEENDVMKLVKERRYVVLQGAPGTGKTRLAKLIAQNDNAKVFFTQFHAETTYLDFVSGIMPVLNSESVQYEEVQGVFVQAIDYAYRYKDEKVYLIIDEINRANLSNVLGQAFYLFERNMDKSDISIQLAKELEVTELPSNLYVIATMNTADRSLAVVDFALRRRFAWYTLYPHVINVSDEHFFKKEFQEISYIFEMYAKDEELDLQPGQGYFLAKNGEEMCNRLKYELMPLIKEYLREGMILLGKDSFVKFFRDAIGEEMFK